MSRYFDKVFWPLIFTVLFAVSAYSTLALRKIRTQQPRVPPGRDEQVFSARHYALLQSGKLIDWPRDMKVLGEVPPEPVMGYGLILAIDDLSCDVCRDEQTQFALAIARALDEPSLRIVVHADTPVYARSYMRLNNIEYPVYYDKEGRFFENNDLGSTPMLLLHNPRGEVIAAHFPVPDRPEVSAPFHAFVRAFFELEVGPGTSGGEGP